MPDLLIEQFRDDKDGGNAVNRTITVVAVLAMLSPAYAQLGGQSFGNVNFQDDNISEAEIQMANSDFGNPGMLPDNPLYFFKRFGEGVKLAFAFDENTKAKLHLEFARTRLAEAKAMAEQNKNITASFASEFEKELSQLNLTSEEVQTVLEKSKIVLAGVLEKVPEREKPMIDDVLNRTFYMGFNWTGNLTCPGPLQLHGWKDNLSYNQTGNWTGCMGPPPIGNWTAPNWTDWNDRMKENMERMKERIKENFNRTMGSASSQIEAATEAISKTRDQFANWTGGNVTNATVLNLLDQADAKIAEARTAFNQSDYPEALDLANAAEHLAIAAERVMESPRRPMPMMRGNQNEDNNSDEDGHGRGMPGRR